MAKSMVASTARSKLLGSSRSPGDGAAAGGQPTRTLRRVAIQSAEVGRRAVARANAAIADLETPALIRADLGLGG
jgi:hypothetical protein